jgi:hypothetical protein
MKSICVAVVALLASLTAWAVTPQQEAAIRQTYLRATFSNEASMIYKRAEPGPTGKAHGLTEFLAANKLTFPLSGFQEEDVPGNNNLISSVYSNLAGRRILGVTPGTQDFDNFGVREPEGDIINLYWKDGQNEGIGGYRISDINALRGESWQKLVTFSVVAEYQGEKIPPYQAFFLFDGDKILPQDPFMPGNGLEMLASAPASKLYPSILLKHWSSSPEVQQWVKEHQMPSAPQNELYCDITTARCGFISNKLVSKLND